MQEILPTLRVPERKRHSGTVIRKLSVLTAERIFSLRHAMRAGMTDDEIFDHCYIDRWFLAQIRQIVDFEEELAATAGN